MSRYIGKRVSYPCGQCGKQFTLNNKSVDDSQKSGEVFCSEQCFEQFYLSDVSNAKRTVCPNCKAGAYYIWQYAPKYTCCFCGTTWAK